MEGQGEGQGIGQGAGQVTGSPTGDGLDLSPQDDLGTEDAADEARKAQEQADQELLERANKRLTKGLDAVKLNREEANEDVKFRRGGEYQWDPQMLNARKGKGRPSETFNKLPRFIHEIVNSARMARPAGKVGKGPGGDERVATLLEDHMRQIEFDSEADIAYDTAIEHAAERGEGFIGADLVRAEDGSGRLTLEIQRIPNPNLEIPDPACKKPTKADARWWWSLEFMDEDDFYATWPEEEDRPGLMGYVDKARRVVRRAVSGAEGLDVPNADGTQGTRICIGRYFEVVDQAEAAETPEAEAQESAADEQHEAGTDRQAPLAGRRVMMYWLSKRRVLQRSEWPGKYIPRAAVIGTEVNDNGQRITEGVIRHAKGAQRMENYAKSTGLEDLGLTARRPPIIAAEAIAGYEESYKKAHTDPQAYLLFHAYDEEGRQLPAPLPPMPAQPSGGALALSQTAGDDLYALTGIAPANLIQDKSSRGEQHELARQRKGEVATFHYADNLARAIRHIWRIGVDALPTVLEGQTEVCGRTEHGETRIEKIGPTRDGEPVDVDFENGPDGSPVPVITYNLKVGHYNVWVDAGPQLPTRQAEAQEGIIELIRAIAAPGTPLAAALAPLVAQNSDWPMKDTMYKVLLATLPPNIQGIYTQQADGDAERGLAIATQQLAQAQQGIQQLQAAVQQLAAQVKDKVVEQQIKVFQAKLKLLGEKVTASAQVQAARYKAMSHLRGKVLDHASKTAPPLAHMMDAAGPEPDTGGTGPAGAGDPAAGGDLNQGG